MKQVIFINNADSWLAEKWINVFLKQLNLIDWCLPGELITDQDFQFLSKFWAMLLNKPGVKLLYSTAYYPQTNGLSERINQKVKITLRFFIHTLVNITLWP